MSCILSIHCDLMVVSDYGVEILNFVGVPGKLLDVHRIDHGHCALLHKAEYAVDHVAESSEEDPEIKSIQKPSDKSLLVFDRVLEALLHDIF